MKLQVLVFHLCIAIICAGCAAMQPVSQPSTAVTPEPAAEEPEGLPGSHGPFNRNHRAMRPLEEAFRSVEVLRRAESFTPSELRAITSKTRFSPASVSGCDLEVLKAFVASNWSPVVVITSPVGPKHIRAVIGYDDSAQRITLIDPVNLKQAAQANLEYSDFSKQWDDPQKTCLLVSSQGIGEQRIKATLKKHLPEEKVESLVIKTLGKP
jgi:hypothetical protein